MGRRCAPILAALALMLQVLVPQGFMVAPGGDGLAICTGHGPLLVTPHDRSGKAPKAKPDAPCAFAGHGGGAAPVASFAPAPIALALAPIPVKTLRDQIPGRGLAAPPPPSQGPPDLI